MFPGKSFFSAHEVSTCKISGCLSYRILDSGPDGTQTTLTKLVWRLKKGQKRNEALDCLVYGMIAIVYAQSKLGTQPFRKLREHKVQGSTKYNINKVEEPITKPEKKQTRRRTGMGSNWFGK